MDITRLLRREAASRSYAVIEAGDAACPHCRKASEKGDYQPSFRVRIKARATRSSTTGKSHLRPPPPNQGDDRLEEGRTGGRGAAVTPEVLGQPAFPAEAPAYAMIQPAMMIRFSYNSGTKYVNSRPYERRLTRRRTAIDRRECYLHQEHQANVKIEAQLKDTPNRCSAIRGWQGENSRQ